MDSNHLYKLKGAFAEEIKNKLKLLIEDKHLYQSVRIDQNLIKEKVKEEFINLPFDKDIPDLEVIINSLLNANWKADNPASSRSRLVAGRDDKPFDSLSLKLVSIKTICGNCGEYSPMNLKKATDGLSNIWGKSGPLVANHQSIYTLSFQCQNCRDGMEVFIVARDRKKLTIVGRSPMEQVPVPKDIPKEQEKYYSGAIIAFNSGQVLPGLFMLRTLIEQYTRDATDNSSGLADEVLDNYIKSLPDDFNSRFPSLNKVYSNLSDAIHSAEESEELFLESQHKIEDHFEAKRIYQAYDKS